MDKDKELMLNALRIVTGESDMLMTNDMGKALFKERTDALAALQGAKEALEDAFAIIQRGFALNDDRALIEAALETARKQLKDLRWLNEIDNEWEKKVLK